MLRCCHDRRNLNEDCYSVACKILINATVLGLMDDNSDDDCKKRCIGGLYDAASGGYLRPSG